MIISQFQEWIGWGWAALFLVWLGGTVLILTVVYRLFMERLASRIPTAVVFIIWTLAVLAAGGKMLGFGAPPG